MTPAELPVGIADRIEPMPSGCWRWTGYLTTQGYGQIQVGDRKHQAHRYIYELTVEAVAAADTMDHLCRNRWCVNPDHLEPVPNRENILRGLMPSANRQRCKAGRHDITSPGAVYTDCEGVDRCRECRRDSKSAYRARRKEGIGT